MSASKLSVAQIGQSIKDTICLRRELENAKRGRADHWSANYLEAAEPHNDDHYDALRRMLAHAQAETLEDAAIQIAEAMNVVDLIQDQYPDEHEDYYVKRDFRAVRRLLFSALMVVDGAADRKLADTIDVQFAGANINPWTPAEDRIAAVEKRVGK